MPPHQILVDNMPLLHHACKYMPESLITDILLENDSIVSHINDKHDGFTALYHAAIDAGGKSHAVIKMMELEAQGRFQGKENKKLQKISEAFTIL